MIEIEVPSVSHGHNPLYFEDTSPNQRKAFAQKITDLLRQGHAIFLTDGEDSRLVKGYDPDDNEFLLKASKKPIPKEAKTLDSSGKEVGFLPSRVSASGKKVTAVAPPKGG